MSAETALASTLRRRVRRSAPAVAAVLMAVLSLGVPAAASSGPSGSGNAGNAQYVPQRPCDPSHDPICRQEVLGPQLHGARPAASDHPSGARSGTPAARGAVGGPAPAGGQSRHASDTGDGSTGTGGGHVPTSASGQTSRHVGSGTASGASRGRSSREGRSPSSSSADHAERAERAAIEQSGVGLSTTDNAAVAVLFGCAGLGLVGVWWRRRTRRRL